MCHMVRFRTIFSITMASILLSFLTQYPKLFLILSSIPLLFFLRSLRGIHPVNLPLLGCSPNIVIHWSHMHEWLTELLCSNSTINFKGPIFTNVDKLLTSDPANVRHVFTTKFSNYCKGEDFVEIFEILGDGIFKANGEHWRFLRRMSHKLVADSRFQMFVGEKTRKKVEEGLLPVLGKRVATGELFDLQDVFLRLTFDTTSILVFGFDPNCLTADVEPLPEVEFTKAFDEIEENLFYRHCLPTSWWKLMKWLRVGPEKRVAEAIEIVESNIAYYISKRTTEIKETACDADAVVSDLLSTLLRSPDEFELHGHDSTKFLRDFAVTFLTAGRDTTSSALTWFFYLLSHNPSVESKILDELSVAVSDHTKLVYLHAALSESLRLFPPIPFEHKAAISPDVLPSGHVVHPRRPILFSLYTMERMEEIWGKDCREFKPERWITETGTVRREPSYKFFTFSAGPRTCLGKETVFVQIKMIAAAIISRFKVEATAGQQTAIPRLSVILHMKGGFMVRVSERERPLVGW